MRLYKVYMRVGDPDSRDCKRYQEYVAARSFTELQEVCDTQLQGTMYLHSCITTKLYNVIEDEVCDLVAELDDIDVYEEAQ